MYRNHSTLFLSTSLLVACPSGGDPGGGPIDLGTSTTSSAISTSTETPTTSLPTGEASSTSTGAPADGTTSGSSSSSTTTTTTDETTGSSSSTTTDGPSLSCGDGELDPGEECDLSAAINDDNGACTLECKLAKCGDNLIWNGQEACDNGPNNNDTLYGGCTTQCALGPRCNDGKLQDPEECDLGADNGNGEFPANSVPCDDGCRFDAKLAFLSSVAFTGGQLKSAEDAHTECQKLAAGAGFDNATNFSAWISDASYSPSKGFTKATGMPYVRPDGVRVANDWDDLILNGPDDGITVTETGTTLLGMGVWTGTGPDGELAEDTLTCKGWSSSALGDKGHRGHSGVKKQPGPVWSQWLDNDHWTTYAALSCSFAYQIYCFEQ